MRMFTAIRCPKCAAPLGERRRVCANCKAPGLSADVEDYLIDELNALNKAYSDEPVELTPCCIRASVLRALGDVERALAEYEAVLKLAPDDAEALNGRNELVEAFSRLAPELRDRDGGG